MHVWWKRANRQGPSARWVHVGGRKTVMALMANFKGEPKRALVGADGKV
jgi:hypothetical protein